MGRKAGRWKNTLVGWLLVLIALPLGFFTVTRCMDKLASTSWPATRAQVVAFETHTSAKSAARCAHLRYRYLIGGETFTSTRWTLETRVICYRDEQAAGALASRFRRGADIAIRYDPSDPEKAVVYLAGPAVSDLIFLLVAAALLPTGIHILRARHD